MNTKGSDPAFPAILSLSRDVAHFPGMTLRDYFAAKAMQGLCGNQEWLKNSFRRTGVDAEIFVTKAAYEIADGMLAERAK